MIPLQLSSVASKQRSGAVLTHPLASAWASGIESRVPAAFRAEELPRALHAEMERAARARPEPTRNRVSVEPRFAALWLT